MDENKLIKYDDKQLQKVGNAITVTNKLLALVEQQLIPYRKGDKWGYCDENKNIVIECDFDEDQGINFFKNGISVVGCDGYIYLMNRHRDVIETNYNSRGEYSEGLLCVCLNEKYGFIDKYGIEIIKCKYDWADEFKEGLAKVGIGNQVAGNPLKIGFINRLGEEVIPINQFNVNDISDKTIRIESADFVAYFDIYGNKIFKISKNGNLINSFSFKEGLLRVRKNKKYGFINKRGDVVVPLHFIEARDYSDGLAYVIDMDYNEMYIDVNGATVINFKSIENRRLGDFKEGVAKIYSEKRYGYIDKAGEMKIDFQYCHAGDFCEGLAKVSFDKYNTKCGFIDKHGSIVIECKYDYANDFKNGFSWVEFNSKYGIINNRGVEFWED